MEGVEGPFTYPCALRTVGGIEQEVWLVYISAGLGCDVISVATTPS
jgi:hypothetical protein